MSPRHKAVGLTAAIIAMMLTGCTDENPVAVQEPDSGSATSAALASAVVPDGAANRTAFFGLYFPAGMPGTGSACPYVWQDPFFCVIDPGSWAELPSGRVRIRDMAVYELAFSWRDGGEVEPRKTGYDVVVANANLDGSLSGPTWGTWNLYSFADELMFSGTFTGSFENGIPAVHFVGQGVGIYAGQQMRGDIGRSPDAAGNNMYGWILEPGTH